MNHADAHNSSTALLGAGQTFTGQWQQLDAPQVACNVKSDQAGTLYVDIGLPVSGGGIEVSFTRVVAVRADEPKFIALVRMPGRYHRVRYVNGAVAQTLFGLLTAVGEGMFPYSSTSEGEIRTTVAEQEDNVFAAFGKTGIVATGWAVLVDKSDTTNFPHRETGRLDLSAVYLQVDRDSTGEGAARVGVVTRIDGTDADVTFVQGISFNKSDDRHINRDRNFSPSQLKCAVVGGATPYIASQFKQTNVAALNTATALDSPRGAATVIPAVGDLVIYYERTAGSFDMSVSAFYHGQVETN